MAFRPHTPSSPWVSSLVKPTRKWTLSFPGWEWQVQTMQTQLLLTLGLPPAPTPKTKAICPSFWPSQFRMAWVPALPGSLHYVSNKTFYPLLVHVWHQPSEPLLQGWWAVCRANEDKNIQANWALLCWSSEDCCEHSACLAEETWSHAFIIQALPPRTVYLVGLVVGKLFPPSWQCVFFSAVIALLCVHCSLVKIFSLTLNIQFVYPVLFTYSPKTLNPYTLSVKTPQTNWLCTLPYAFASRFFFSSKWGFIL